MKLAATLVLSGFFCQYTQACSEISGKYTTVSESEWSYHLFISDENVVLHYSAHEHTEDEKMAETEETENGECHFINGKYVLTFNNNKYIFEYHSQLSHKSFGGSGSSPGIVVKNLIPGTSLEFWEESAIR